MGKILASPLLLTLLFFVLLAPISTAGTQSAIHIIRPTHPHENIGSGG